MSQKGHDGTRLSTISRMPDGAPVNLSSGLPETVLPPEPPAVVSGLRAATGRDPVAAVVRDHPRSLAGWAALGDLARDPVEAYACYRVGYHRGLDTLRANGWRGSGYVRWAHESNRGFLARPRRAAADRRRDRGARRGGTLRRVPPPARPGLGSAGGVGSAHARRPIGHHRAHVHLRRADRRRRLRRTWRPVRRRGDHRGGFADDQRAAATR